MTTSIEKQGKTVDEAIELALGELGSEREKVNIEIIEEPSKGLFGLIGVKPARVRITLKPDPLRMLQDFIVELCAHMGTKVEIQVVEETQEQASLDITGDNLGMLIGKHGQTLNSLQYLANVYYGRSAGEHRRVVVDVGGYRMRREETLRRLALRLAEKAKRSRRKVMLEPMSAHERRIIHTALQGDKSIVTYSEGNEPYRKVVIALK